MYYICSWFFHCISNVIENKNSKLPHIYQNSNMSSNFHPPSLLHHSFASFNFLMMVGNMRQQLQIQQLSSLLRLGCIERKLEKSGYFYFLFFLSLLANWNPANHFISQKKKKKSRFLAKVSPVKKIGCLRWRLSLLIWQSAAGSSPEWQHHGHVMHMRALLFLTLQNGV